MTLVRIPTFLPESRATSAIDSNLPPSGATPIMPFFVLEPHAIAVPLAAESVMNELAERVVVSAWWGIEFIASPFPVFMRASSSAVMRCGIDMPSPMKRKTYFTGFAALRRKHCGGSRKSGQARELFWEFPLR